MDIYDGNSESTILTDQNSIYNYSSIDDSVPSFLEEEASYPISPCDFGIVYTCLWVLSFIILLDDVVFPVIVSTIASDFFSLNQMIWLSASYPLTKVISISVYPHIFESFGHKKAYLLSVGLLLIGSIGCSISGSKEELIIFRLIMGLGGGGHNDNSPTLKQLLPSSELPFYLILLLLCWIIAFFIGPLVGGFFAFMQFWRWYFYFNGTIYLFSYLCLYMYLNIPDPETSLWQKIMNVDFVGTFLILSSCALLISGISWTNGDYPWDSNIPHICIILSLVLVVAFFIFEWSISNKPMLPFSRCNFTILFSKLTSFFVGLTTVATSIYLPVYFKIIYNSTGFEAGLSLFPLYFSLIFVASISSIIAHYFNRYRSFIIFGSVLTLSSNLLMASRLGLNISFYELNSYLALIGCGVGFCLQNTIGLADYSVQSNDREAIYSLSLIALLNECLGPAIFGSIFYTILKYNIHFYFPEIDINTIISSFDVISAHPIGDRLKIQTSYIIATRVMYLALIPFSFLGCITSIFLKDDVVES